jgi:hypothetical protein
LLSSFLFCYQGERELRFVRQIRNSFSELKNSAEAAETPFDRELQQNCLSQATDEDFRELLQSTADAVTTITT